jgi:uncharacterized protein YegL
MNTEIICILDRSGSMSPIIKSSTEGFNKFVNQQREEEGDARISLILFDDKIECVYNTVDLKTVNELNEDVYTTRGMTALNDAIGMTVTKHADRIKTEAWADKVVVCILTDGQENSSKEYTQASVKDLITEYEEKGWCFVFLAANQDAFATSAGYGMQARNTANFSADHQGTLGAYGTMNSTVTTYRNSPTTNAKTTSKKSAS